MIILQVGSNLIRSTLTTSSKVNSRGTHIIQQQPSRDAVDIEQGSLGFSELTLVIKLQRQLLWEVLDRNTSTSTLTLVW